MISNANMKLYGCLIENHSDVQIVHCDNKCTPEAKCNTVSYPKVEAPHPNCNHNLAISNRYICYAVKGVLLRVIHTTNSSKLLLRGHESTIVDAKFAQCKLHDNVLCSVDDGSDPSGELRESIDNKTHIYMWKLIEGTTLTADNTLELMSELICGYRIRASFVVPHPSNPSIWVVGFKNCIAVLNTDKSSNQLDMNATTYETLSCCVSFNTDSNAEALSVIDASFSVVGDSISVSLRNTQKNTIECAVYTYLEVDHKLCVHTPPRYMNDYCRSFDTVLYSVNERITCIMEGISGTCLKAFNQSNEIVQHLELQFIILNDGFGTADTAHRECSMNLIMHSDGHLLLVSHKNSKYVAFVSLNNGIFTHVTYVDLHFASLYPVTTVLSGEEYYSSGNSNSNATAVSSNPRGAEAGVGHGGVIDHIEIACLQILNPSKAAIQQYHVKIKDVYVAPATTAAGITSTSAPAPVVTKQTDMLKSLLRSPGESSPTPAASAPAPAPVVTKQTDMLKSLLRSPGESSPTPAASAPAPAPVVTKQTDMLKSLLRSPGESSPTPAASASCTTALAPATVNKLSRSDEGPAPSDLPKLQILKRQQPSPVPLKGTETTSAANAEPNAESRVISPSVSTATNTASTSQATGACIVNGGGTAGAGMSPSSLFLKSIKRNASVVVPASTKAQSPTTSNAPTATSPPSTSMSVSPPATVPLAPTSSDGHNASTKPVTEACVREMISTMQSNILNQIASSQNGASLNANPVEDEYKCMMKSVWKETMAEMHSNKEASNAFKKVIETTMLPKFQKSCDVMFSQIHAGFATSLSKLLEKNNEYYQKQLEAYVNTNETLMLGMLEEKVLPKIIQSYEAQQQVQYDMIMKYMSRNSDIQFSQIKELQSLVMNLQNKLEVVSLVQQQHAKQDKGGVMSLLSTIENKLERLSIEVGKGSTRGNGKVEVAVVEYEEDPLCLLQEGQLGAAIECALEQKNLDTIDALLLRINEEDVVELYQSGTYEGLKLVLFCLIQQISIDLLHNKAYCVTNGLEAVDENVSGKIKNKVDWLKCLIMLVAETDNGVSGDDDKNSTFAPISAKILSNLQMIHKKMIMSKNSKSPTATTPIKADGGEFIMVPSHPSSASTLKRDVQMLIFVLQQQQ